MARQHLVAGLFVLTVGCAAAPPPRRAAPIPADLEAWVSADQPTLPRAHAVARGSAEEPRGSTKRHRIVPPLEQTRRPIRRTRVDVRFQGADMVSAFQFLADTGKFNLVMQDGLAGKVSASLHGVDAYDALVSLAEANGAAVQYEREIVVVRKR